MILLDQMPVASTTTRSHSKLPEFSVGLDPGNEGAFVVLHNNVVLVAARWKKVTRSKRKVFEMHIASIADPLKVLQASRPSEVGYRLAQELVSLGIESAELAVEDVYFGRNPKTSTVLARTAGAMVGPVEQQLNTTARWVMAGEWRSLVLGIPRNTKREAAKQASLKLMPARVDMLNQMLGRIGRLDHVTDAAGIAQWARLSNQHQQEKTRWPGGRLPAG